MNKKQPYVKEFDSMGNCTNPITKETPYLHTSLSTRKLRKGHHRINTLTIGNEVMYFLQRRVRNHKWINA